MTSILTFIVDFIKQHGAWGLLAITLFVIQRMAIYIENMQRKHQDTVKQLLLDHNKQQKAETKELVGAMLSTEKALQAVNQTLNVIASRRE